MTIQRILIILFIFGGYQSCDLDQGEIRSRPTDHGDDLSGYLEEESASAPKGETISVTIGNSNVYVPSGAVANDYQVRLRTLAKRPEDPKTVDLEALGDIVHVSFLNNLGEAFDQLDIFDDAYLFRQDLAGTDGENVAFVIKNSANGETLFVKSQRGTGGISLSGLLYQASLTLVDFVIFATTLPDDANSPIIVLNNGRDASPSNDTEGGSSNENSTSNASSSVDCSHLAGGLWIGVPRNIDVGQYKDFCIFKYEARQESSSAIAISTHEGEPWTQISRGTIENIDSNVNGTTAIQACKRIGDDHQYGLPTNAMWQTVARSIETATDGTKLVNWENGSPDGNNRINAGNHAGGQILAAHQNDEFGCLDADSVTNSECNGTWNQFKRTHTLSNDAVIWDFSGNLREMIIDDADSNYPQENSAYAGACDGDASDFLRVKFGPAYDCRNKPKAPLSYGGLGYIDSISPIAGLAILRGGGPNLDNKVGIYAAVRFLSTALKDNTIGFRCAVELSD